MKDAREALKNRFTKKPTSLKKELSVQDTTSASPSDGKEMRTWVSVSDKISKKDMDKIDVSKVKGGEIDIDSEPGKGSRFRLVFPAARVRRALMAASENAAA